MIFRKYKFKNGKIREQRLGGDPGDSEDKVWKIGSMIEQIWIPDEVTWDLIHWSVTHKKQEED